MLNGSNAPLWSKVANTLHTEGYYAKMRKRFYGNEENVVVEMMRLQDNSIRLTIAGRSRKNILIL